MTQRVSDNRKRYFGIATGSYGVHRVSNPLHMQAQDRPLRGAKHEDGNRPACKILLVADILVGGQQQLEPGLFRCGE